MLLITPYHNYDDGGIGLANLHLSNLPPTIRVGEYTLYRKTELHLTLLHVDELATLIHPIHSNNMAEELVEQFKIYSADHDIASYELLQHFRFVERAERKSLIIMANVPRLPGLFAKLSKLYQVTLPVQPAHITLYTLQPDKGIGISSHDVLEQISRPADVTQLNVTSS